MSYSDYINYSLDPVGKSRFFGIYSGIVVNNSDPKNAYRLQVSVPQITGSDYLDWAEPCFNPIPGTIAIPAIGDKVWITFESGDTSYPVWTGIAEPTPPTVANTYCGAFLSTSTQASSTTPQAITFTSSATTLSNGITLVSNSRIRFANAGTYNLQFAGQIYQSSNGNPAINIWIKKNGITTVDNSNWQFDLSNQNHFSVPAFSYLATFSAGDYIEFYWKSDSPVSLTYYPSTPSYPATASAAVNVIQI